MHGSKFYQDSLIPTDVDKLKLFRGQEPTETGERTGDESQVGEENTSGSSEKLNSLSSDHTPNIFVAVVLGFSLEASSYATVVLRELLKISIAPDYQGKLSGDPKALPNKIAG